MWARLLGGSVLRADDDSPKRYHVFERNIIVLMLMISIIPLTIMAIIYQHEYHSSIEKEIVNPLQALANKTKHSFELFLEERLSAIRFVASSYSFEDLSDQKVLNRIFKTLMDEYCCLIDLGLINDKGIQLSYAGPYEFLGKDYSKQSWFQEVTIKGDYISDVFMGYRQIPHMAIAVLRRTTDGRSLILRATIDTRKFDNIIASMGLDPESDAFLINKKSILQTPSRLYGKILDQYPVNVPPGNYGAVVVSKTDPQGREMFNAYAPFSIADYILVLVKQRSAVLKPWYTLSSKMIFIFVISVIAIVLLVLKITDTVVNNVKEADQKRELAFREIQHTHKLSSIGRLAAGVAHEINNPMAIINEKAGLMKDLVVYDDQFHKKEKFLELLNSILQSVERCKTITHRLLGFARRMEVQLEELDLNELIRETLGFLEKEALHRNIECELNLMDTLPHISSDRGQLQQVFLNLFSNAFDAVEDSGHITITSRDESPEGVVVSVKDNGKGMSEATVAEIFEPFFTTKKGYGTGLGLAITYGIVKNMGGTIQVDSELGTGTTFTVYLLKNGRIGSSE